MIRSELALSAYTIYNELLSRKPDAIDHMTTFLRMPEVQSDCIKLSKKIRELSQVLTINSEIVACGAGTGYVPFAPPSNGRIYCTALYYFLAKQAQAYLKAAMLAIEIGDEGRARALLAELMIFSPGYEKILTEREASLGLLKAIQELFISKTLDVWVDKHQSDIKRLHVRGYILNYLKSTGIKKQKLLLASPITKLPNIFISSAFEDLKHISFGAGNKLQEIPSLIGCKNLETLYLGRNPISRFGISFETFPNFRELITDTDTVESVNSVNKVAFNVMPWRRDPSVKPSHHFTIDYYVEIEKSAQPLRRSLRNGEPLQVSAILSYLNSILSYRQTEDKKLIGYHIQQVNPILILFFGGSLPIHAFDEEDTLMIYNAKPKINQIGINENYSAFAPLLKNWRILEEWYNDNGFALTTPLVPLIGFFRSWYENIWLGLLQEKAEPYKLLAFFEYIAELKSVITCLECYGFIQDSQEKTMTRLQEILPALDDPASGLRYLALFFTHSFELKKSPLFDIYKQEVQKELEKLEAVNPDLALRYKALEIGSSLEKEVIGDDDSDGY
jgi:hypothetical protein